MVADIHPSQFVASCRYLFGGHWHIALSRELGCEKQDIADMADGSAPISEEALKALGRAYERRIAGLQRRLAELEAV